MMPTDDDARFIAAVLGNTCTHEQAFDLDGDTLFLEGCSALLLEAGMPATRMVRKATYVLGVLTLFLDNEKRRYCVKW